MATKIFPLCGADGAGDFFPRAVPKNTRQIARNVL